MKNLNFKATFAAFITSSVLLTTGVVPMQTAQASGPGGPTILTPLKPNICLTKPWLCKNGGFKLPPKAPPPPPPAPKGGLTDGQKIGLGILGAVAVGTIIANSRNQPANPAPYNNHVAFCSGKYKTFDVNTNTFMSNAGYRKPCISPYMQ